MVPEPQGRGQGAVVLTLDTGHQRCFRIVELSTLYPRFIHNLSYSNLVRAAGGMGDDAEADEGPAEVFGVHRLRLAPGTKSGYLGVRQTKSTKNPWQPWVHLKGEKRRCLGSFRTPQQAAVARARALACGAETLPSPRKQAGRNSGAD